MQNFKQTLDHILSDIRVELSDEFDKNFQRKGFFQNNGWKISRRPGAKTPLMNTGNLRRSICAQVSGSSVTFSSSLPYASIHNEGGEITVTTKMKKYFWAQYMKYGGKNAKANANAQANYYKAMALKEVGSKIIIPQRQFIGHHQSLDPVIKNIIVKNMDEYMSKVFNKNNK